MPITHETFENSSTNDNSTMESFPLDAPRWSMLAMIIIIITTALGNALVCLAVSCERRLQNMNNYFLMSLAFADLLVAILVMPPAMASEIYGYFPFSPYICVIWSTMDVLLCTASIWHMCIMSMDRYFSLRYPIRYGRNRTTRMVVVKIAISWLIPVAICLALPVKGFSDLTNIYSDSICAPRMKGFVLFGSLLAFYLPLVIMVLTYALTISILRNNQRRLRRFAKDRLKVKKAPSVKEETKVSIKGVPRNLMIEGLSVITITSMGLTSVGLSPADSAEAEQFPRQTPTFPGQPTTASDETRTNDDHSVLDIDERNRNNGKLKEEHKNTEKNCQKQPSATEMFEPVNCNSEETRIGCFAQNKQIEALSDGAGTKSLLVVDNRNKILPLIAMNGFNSSRNSFLSENSHLDSTILTKQSLTELSYSPGQAVSKKFLADTAVKSDHLLKVPSMVRDRNACDEKVSAALKENFDRVEMKKKKSILTECQNRLFNLRYILKQKTAKNNNKNYNYYGKQSEIRLPLRQVNSLNISSNTEAYSQPNSEFSGITVTRSHSMKQNFNGKRNSNDKIDSNKQSNDDEGLINTDTISKFTLYNGFNAATNGQCKQDEDAESLDTKTSVVTVSLFDDTTSLNQNNGKCVLDSKSTDLEIKIRENTKQEVSAYNADELLNSPIHVNSDTEIRFPGKKIPEISIHGKSSVTCNACSGGCYKRNLGNTGLKTNTNAPTKCRHVKSDSDIREGSVKSETTGIQSSNFLYVPHIPNGSPYKKSTSGRYGEFKENNKAENHLNLEQDREEKTKYVISSESNSNSSAESDKFRNIEKQSPKSVSNRKQIDVSDCNSFVSNFSHKEETGSWLLLNSRASSLNSLQSFFEEDQRNCAAKNSKLHFERNEKSVYYNKNIPEVFISSSHNGIQCEALHQNSTQTNCLKPNHTSDVYNDYSTIPSINCSLSSSFNLDENDFKMKKRWRLSNSSFNFGSQIFGSSDAQSYTCNSGHAVSGRNKSEQVSASGRRRYFRAAKRKGSNERKASKVLGIIFAVFVLLWLPFFIYNIITVFCDGCKGKMPAYVSSTFLWLGYVSSLANPIIYTMFSTSFRTVFYRLITCQYATCKKQSRSLYNVLYKK